MIIKIVIFPVLRILKTWNMLKASHTFVTAKKNQTV